MTVDEFVQIYERNYGERPSQEIIEYAKEHVIDISLLTPQVALPHSIDKVVSIAPFDKKRLTRHLLALVQKEDLMILP